MTPRDIGRGIGAIGIVVGINLLFGIVGYFIAFLFAYGFSDEITPAQHVFFLFMIGALTALAAAVSVPAIKPALGVRVKQTAAFAGSVSATLNLVVLGLGSIISAQHKDDGSVSETFSTSTDVIVATTLLGGAVIAAWFVRHSWPRRTRA